MNMSHFDKVATEEGVEDGTEKNDGSDEVKATLLTGSVFELLHDAPIVALLVVILREGDRKDGRLVVS